jgi:hypothetical protein
VYLDDRRVPEPTLPKHLTENPPPKKTRPLAASPQPAEFYSQYQCPVCHATIAEAHGADFIGHTPCLHRGPCPRWSCVRTYYGTSRKWNISYKGNQPLYCQAAGCGRKIEGWWYVKAVISPERRGVIPLAVQDPALEKAWEKVMKKEKAKREKEERMEEKIKKLKDKKERGPLVQDRLQLFVCIATGCGMICCAPFICLGDALIW